MFQIISPRDANKPPLIKVRFSNGIEDEFDLIPTENFGPLTKRCSYYGRLRNHLSSSISVTGCLDKNDSQMEITLISDHNIDKMFRVDIAGNVEIIRSPFENGGIFSF